MVATTEYIMEDKYIECLAEISVKRYQEMIGHALKLEAKVASLEMQVNQLRQDNETLATQLESSSKRKTKTAAKSAEETL
jgi:outer membrane murein-binding lipoprotein Lpp